MSSFETKCVHGGQKPDPTTGAIVTPVYMTATYVLDKIGGGKGYDYSRTINPTRAAMENLLAELEGAKHGIAFASGLAAITNILSLLSKGDHVVSTDDIYGGVYRLFEQVLKRFGLEFTYADTSQPENIESAIKDNTKMLWIETPTNPLLKITDVEAAAKIAKEKNLISVVDSTFATPYSLRPLEYGIDIAMHSTTKYISGHNNLIGGFAATNSDSLGEKLSFLQNATGAIPGPMDCWLVMLGTKTLHLRMERHEKNAREIAAFLESHPKIERVIYPGLESHPQHEIAKRQMKGFGGMISFELKGGVNYPNINVREVLPGERFANSLKLVLLAESLGAVESMLTHPATMTHKSIPREQRLARGITDGLVRLSVGIEDAGDIKADLAQALEKA